MAKSVSSNTLKQRLMFTIIDTWPFPVKKLWNNRVSLLSRKGTICGWLSLQTYAYEFSTFKQISTQYSLVSTDLLVETIDRYQPCINIHTSTQLIWKQRQEDDLTELLVWKYLMTNWNKTFISLYSSRHCSLQPIDQDVQFTVLIKALWATVYGPKCS